MAVFWMGHRVDGRNRRKHPDPQKLADDRPGEAVRGRDGKQYVSIKPAVATNRVKRG